MTDQELADAINVALSDLLTSVINAKQAGLAVSFKDTSPFSGRIRIDLDSVFEVAITRTLR